MFKNIKENVYQGNKIYCKFDIVLGINEYKFVVFWGSREELETIKTPSQLFKDYKFFAKVNEYNGKNYINYTLSLPKSN